MAENEEQPPSPQSPQSPQSAQTPTSRKFKREDFDLMHTLGYGSYSKVMLAQHISTGTRYAIKVVSKAHMIQEKKVHYVMNERDILKSLNHPNIVRLISTFQTPEDLFFVLEYCEGGELLKHIAKVGGFIVETTRKMAAEVVNGLGHLRENNIIHRDLKPENILLDKFDHLKLVDFGTAIKSTEEPGPLQEAPLTPDPSEEQDFSQSFSNSDHSKSFCGTAQYASPELLTNCTTTYSSDLWALGCIVYQMLTSKRPFQDPSDYLTFKRILDLDITYPDDFPATARDLCEKLLVLNPHERLGVGPNGIAELKAHPFFEGINFDTLPTETLNYEWKARAPKWVPDSSVSTCMDCQKTFTLFLRKHHCRACGKVFCRHCSSKSTPLPHLDMHQPVRVCDSCYQSCKPHNTSPTRSAGNSMGGLLNSPSSKSPRGASGSGGKPG
eukprot:TRINITY_DN67775_c3_g1_i1.p1 TRINITY_DN67775_c3_g1~~TRINITY_DN67775_c3_g1_i1.p1  ORF type:complete len:440 (-),score=27.05 TRINITY_DN67775_c3_g1_i1:126-1445(-)